jgi:hypothetical protein
MNREMELFQKVERGEISAHEAARLLEELYNRGAAQVTAEPIIVQQADPGHDPEPHNADIRHFSNVFHWWLIPFVAGVLMTTLGAFWMYLGWNEGEITFGFWLAWLPFSVGILLMAFSWRARASHWIHMRINQGPGRRPKHVTLSFPLPFSLVKWANRKFGQHFPSEVRGMDLDDLLDSIEESVTSDNPIYLWVDDEKEQQQVEVWIGRGAEWGR